MINSVIKHSTAMCEYLHKGLGEVYSEEDMSMVKDIRTVLRGSNVKTQTPPHPTAEFSAILHVRQLYFPYLEDLQFTAPGRESFPETVCFVLLEVHFHHTS